MIAFKRTAEDDTFAGTFNITGKNKCPNVNECSETE